MDTFVARFIQPSRLLFAVVVALVVLAIALWLSAALGGSHDIDSLIGPFRWQPTEPFVA